MYNNSNIQNKQIEINTCKILSLFKISRTHVWKMTPPPPPPPPLDFANLRLLLKKYPLLRENGYEHDIHFGREWEGRV